jgi:hypothetical protein
MSSFMTFAEFLQRRDPQRGSPDPIPKVADSQIGDVGGRTTDGETVHPGLLDDRDRLAERSLFRGFFKAVNPARPVSPTNSRLLASPNRKRLKSQVMGR